MLAQNPAAAIVASFRRRIASLPDWAPLASAAVLLSVITAGVRAWPVLTGSAVADILNYQRVGRAILDGHFSETYALPYPYPPPWMFVEASAVWLSQHWDVSFSTVIKLPIVAGDVLLVVFALLILRARGLGLWRASFWALGIALSPVLIMITGFHGQFDSIVLALLVGAAYFGEEAPARYRSLPLSATLLALAIALKLFPVLILPFFLWRCCRNLREAALFTVGALLPTAMLLAPYALVGWHGVRVGLVGYSGVIDHGWASLIRSWLSRTTDRQWSGLPGERTQEFLDRGRVMFLVTWALALLWRGPRHRVLDSSLLVFLLFLFFYPGISSQYLAWVVPLGVIATDLFVAPYMVAATAALTGYYMWFWPATFHRPGAPFTRDWALDLYYWGEWALWLTTGAWMVWRLVPRPAHDGPHRLPRPAIALLVVAVPVGAVIVALQAADVFSETRVIIKAF